MVKYIFINLGVTVWLLSYPFDTIKTIIQSDTYKLKQYDVFKKIIKEGGYHRLFRGLYPTLIRAFNTNGIIFYINELCHFLIDDL